MTDFDFDCPPNSGENPRVFLSLKTDSGSLGQIEIELFRDVFPLGVENFVYLCRGTTFRENIVQIGTHRIKKYIRRTYDGCNVYDKRYNAYIKLGDIYLNNGKSGATIYHDQIIDPPNVDYFYPHETKGLISLIQYTDPKTHSNYYDSNFIITLANATPENHLREFDGKYIVIGRIYKGLDVIDRINNLIVPFAGRVYPFIKVNDCGIISRKLRKVKKCQ
jgi:cyclophilin family peptidyl-prolyl cis-trans isomerase